MRAAKQSVDLGTSFTLAAAAALALCGCGPSGDGADKAAGAKETSTAAPATELAAEPAAAPAEPAAKAPKKAGKGKKAATDAAAGVAAEGTDPTADALASEGTEGDGIKLRTEPKNPRDLTHEKPLDKPVTAAFPKGETAKARPEIEGLPADDPKLGSPLVINGKIIPFEEVRAQVCLGNRGAIEINAAKLKIFVDEEVRRQLAGGADKAKVEVSDEELQASMTELDEKIKAEFPEGALTMSDVMGEFPQEVAASREGMRMTELCRKVFLPDNPDDFPPVTVDAIRAQAAGDVIFQHYRDVYARLKEDPAAAKKSGPELEFDDTIVQQVVEYLDRTAVVQRRPAEGVLYRVNGVDITTDQIWQRLLLRLNESEVRIAKQWIINTKLLRESLEKAGAWLSDEEAEAAFHAYSDPYKDSIFSVERIAMMIKRFPSVDAFKDYRRIYDSFARWKQPEMTPEVLQAHQQARTAKIIGQVSVDVDVILCSAYDMKEQHWKENGWAEAEQRMKDVLKLLVDEKRPWEELLERYSEFYDPATPVSMRAEKRPARPLKGRFRGQMRNPLLSELGENEYLLFLNGNSITDFIFFQQEVGSVADPMKGPLGWYLPRLMRRTKPPERLSVNEEDLKDLVKEDYLLYSLNRYAQQLIQENEVYGLDPLGS